MDAGGIIFVVALAIAYVACSALTSYLAARFDYSHQFLAGVIWPAFLVCHIAIGIIFLLLLPFWFLDEAIELGRKHRERR